MNAQNQLIYTGWEADDVNTKARVIEVLQTLKKFFPEVPYWRARNRYGKGFEDTLEFDIDDAKLEKGFDALDLWRQTLEHFEKLGMDAKFNRIYFTMWSDKWEGAFASLSESDFGLDNWDSEIEEERILPTTDVYERLAKQLGALPTMSHVWMLNHSAFAGDPICLYEPRVPFADYYTIDKHDECLPRIREVRRQVRAAFTTNEIVARLRDLGAEVELLAENRLFAKFGALGGDGGKRILSQLERHITARLE